MKIVEIPRLETRYGTMFVPAADYAQFRWLDLTGASPEHEFIEEAVTLLRERPKGMAFDVGASFGCWALALAKVCTDVFAFEPQPVIHQLLQKTKAANKLKNLYPVNAAVGRAEGHVEVPLLDLGTESNFGGVSLLETFADQPEAATVEVRMLCLDEFADPDDHVSFIKMDIEGGEAAALAGARQVIERCKPVLFIEADHKLSDRQALWTTIEAMGYANIQRGGNILGVPI